ncbi:MAG: HEAT repeat domain-containing protein [Planctomycetota bacterium]|nr:HEAT repeat domain-containing protein [Planctomycetota bacterium]
MLKIRSFAFCVALLASAACAMAAATGPKAAGRAPLGAVDIQGAPDEAKLIAVLKSDAPPQDKAITCKELAVFGSKAAVPALAPLLADKELSSWARIALEAIPGPEVDEALRQAMGKVQGRLLIGVINSLAVRRDAKAVDALIARLKDADADVASAAAAALGRIGGAASAKALEPLLATAPAGVRPEVAEGCILCAERFLAEGNRDEAVKLYDTVRKAEVPKNKIIEATRGAVLARGAAGVPLLVELLKSTDKAFFGLGLRVGRELPGPEATDALAAEMSQAASDRQALMLVALADRGDPKALPAVLKVAKTGATHVRIAAMEAIDRFGNVSCVPLLLEAAIEADADLSQRAKGTLTKLGGQDVDADLLARLPQATGKTREVIIELVGQRRIVAALPVVVKCLEDADAGVRTAVVAALGAIGTDQQVPNLAKALGKADAKEQAGIEKSLLTISSRVGAPCVQPLMPLMQGGDAALRTIALHALACAGGPQALAAVKAAVADKDEAIQDEAVRTLSTWPSMWPEDAGVVEPLLALAKSSKKVTHQVLALRGYLLYVEGSKKLSDADKMTKINAIMPLVKRPEEKRLVISALDAVPTAASLEMLVGLASDAEVANEACAAIVSVVAKKDLKGVSKQQRQAALQTAADKSKGATKKKAEDALKAIK